MLRHAHGAALAACEGARIAAGGGIRYHTRDHGHPASGRWWEYGWPPDLQRVPEQDVVGLVEGLLNRLNADASVRQAQPRTRSVPVPHKPPRAAPDKADGYRARRINEDNLPFFEPDS